MSTVANTEKKKPGRKPAANKPAASKPAAPGQNIDELVKRLDNLEKIVAKFAHFGGGSFGTICREFGIEPYSPNKKDMSKWDSN